MTQREEHDALGYKTIADKAYWGIHTQRALENFPISGLRVPQRFIAAYARVKKACAAANADLGYLDVSRAEAITVACNEIAEGALDDHFPLDALQGGAGTSTNMNINEVIANRANELLGKNIGTYDEVHPIDHVNLNQSTNDTYPTALKITLFQDLRTLSSVIEKLQGAFQKKESEFAEIITIGRTELQDAVPITLGAQFSSFAEAIARDRWRTFKCEERIRTVNIGGTAVGTGLTAPRDYIFLVIEKLRQITGLGMSRSENMIDQTANTDMFIEISGILKAHASNLIKIANDLRTIHFLKEITLPSNQVGSSIMPGKVNPVIAEAVIQAGIKVISNDAIVTETVSRSTLQINEFMPLLSFTLLQSLEILINANTIFEQHVARIRANKDVCRDHTNASTTLITAFLPYITYEKATEFIREFEQAGSVNITEFLYTKLDKELVDRVLSPYNITALGYRKDE